MRAATRTVRFWPAGALPPLPEVCRWWPAGAMPPTDKPDLLHRHFQHQPKETLTYQAKYDADSHGENSSYQAERLPIFAPATTTFHDKRILNYAIGNPSYHAERLLTYASTTTFPRDERIQNYANANPSYHAKQTLNYALTDTSHLEQAASSFSPQRSAEDDWVDRRKAIAALDDILEEITTDSDGMISSEVLASLIVSKMEFTGGAEEMADIIGSLGTGGKVHYSDLQVVFAGMRGKLEEEEAASLDSDETSEWDYDEG
mmetsp:Transcript_111204/g.359027  ORF Transcript_111204/g.359027 Transcript_111204/m.359027 type:complete len:260 (+) Transcript_111204:122-901(+)